MFETLERRVLMDGNILFIRGATRSGGFLDGGSVAVRDEQLADINNASTAAGNHGWATLRATLEGAGYTVEQRAEAREATSGDVSNGKPFRFDAEDLTRYSVIVLGSNNARYPSAIVDALDAYVRNGGAVLFISDGNFGSHWRDAPDSDQAFLARYGVVVNQDAGTYALTRTDGHFVAADHPVLAGVDVFDGEGVSPFVMPVTPPAGVTLTRLVAARNQTRNNDGADPAENFAGSLRATNSRDASLFVGNVARGRFAGYFDRNTFFNANGAGSELAKNDNRELALNLFAWLTDATPPAVTNFAFTQGAPSEAKLTFDDNLYGSLGRKDILLRDPFTAEPIPRDNWGWQVTESDGHAELVVRIKGRQPAGTYQLQINPGKIADDSGNVNARRIRFNFTIAAGGGAESGVIHAKAQAFAGADRRSVADELFGSEVAIA
jgi:hypothetical protein